MSKRSSRSSRAGKETPEANLETRNDAPAQEGGRHEPVTPSWFSNTYPNERPVDLADRYRSKREGEPAIETPGPEAYEAYRRRLEERFQSAKRTAAHAPTPSLTTMYHEAPPLRRPMQGDDLPEGAARYRDWQRRLNAREQVEELPIARSNRVSPLRIAGLLAGACVIGGMAGFSSSNLDVVEPVLEGAASAASTSFTAVASFFGPEDISPKQVAVDGGSLFDTANRTVLTKKPVKIARIDVADASGGLNGPIPLNLQAFPADPEAPIALKISGLPEDAYLTRGKQIASGEWMLMSQDIENVQLVVPTSQTPQLDLSVAAIEEKTGATAAPSREMIVELDLKNVNVVPVNAGPELQSGAATGQQLPSAIPLPIDEAEQSPAENSEARTLFKKGETLFKTGDLVAARRFFMKASELGLAEAAFGVGETYDPVIYRKMNVRGLQPDRKKALEWYSKAADAGFAGAEKAIETLTAAN